MTMSDGSEGTPIVEWQTCDDTCPAAEYYRLIIRDDEPDLPGEWGVIVKQREEDGEWVDIERVGEPWLDGEYTITHAGGDTSSA